MDSLISLRGLPIERIHELFRLTQAMEEVLRRPVPTVPALKGRRIGFAFFEPSTRTRLSFELAARSLSLEVINLSLQTSSMLKGEGILETLTTLKDLGLDGIVIRSPYVGVCSWAEKHLRIGVINAGEGTGEHPTQALLDLYTLNQHWHGETAGKELAIVGDILRSRVARSLIISARTLGIQVTLVAPRTLLPHPIPKGVQVTTDLDEVLPSLDALYLLRVQKERQREGGPYLPDDNDYFFAYGLTPARLKKMKPQAVYLHPGPVNLGVELDPALYPPNPQNLIHLQVRNGVPLRMALFYKLSGGGSP